LIKVFLLPNQEVRLSICQVNDFVCCLLRLMLNLLGCFLWICGKYGYSVDLDLFIRDVMELKG